MALSDQLDERLGNLQQFRRNRPTLLGEANIVLPDATYLLVVNRPEENALLAGNTPFPSTPSTICDDKME
jgi:hypothetical protein